MNSSKHLGFLLPLLIGGGACVGRVESTGVIDSVAPASAQPGLSASVAAAEEILPAGIEREAIHFSYAPLDLVSIGLCKLVSAYDAAAGLYRIERIVEAPDGVYLQLEVVDPWSATTPERPVARVSSDAFDARVGEELGVLLARPSADSRGADRLFPLGGFHDLGSGYTNGQLFALHPISAEQLGAVVTAAVAKAGDPDCPDMQPERELPPEPPALPDQVPGPEIRGR